MNNVLMRNTILSDEPQLLSSGQIESIEQLKKGHVSLSSEPFQRILILAKRILKV